MGSEPAIYPRDVLLSFSATAPSARVAEIVIGVAVASLNFLACTLNRSIHLFAKQTGTLQRVLS